MRRITLELPDDVAERLDGLLALYRSAKERGARWSHDSGLRGPVEPPRDTEALCVDLLDDTVDVQTEFVEDSVR